MTIELRDKRGWGWQTCEDRHCDWLGVSYSDRNCLTVVVVAVHLTIHPCGFPAQPHHIHILLDEHPTVSFIAQVHLLVHDHLCLRHYHVLVSAKLAVRIQNELMCPSRQLLLGAPEKQILANRLHTRKYTA